MRQTINPRKILRPGEGQLPLCEELLVPDVIDTPSEPEHTLEVVPEPSVSLLDRIPTISIGPPGSYVRISENLRHLDVALAAIGGRNSRRDGFLAAVEILPQANDIYDRYGARTPIVVRGAEINAEALDEVIRANFWKASGFQGLRAAGLMKPDELNNEARYMWALFAGSFGGVRGAAKARNKYRKQLSKLAEIAQFEGMLAPEPLSVKSEMDRKKPVIIERRREEREKERQQYESEWRHGGHRAAA